MTDIDILEKPAHISEHMVTVPMLECFVGTEAVGREADRRYLIKKAANYYLNTRGNNVQAANITVVDAQSENDFRILEPLTEGQRIEVDNIRRCQRAIEVGPRLESKVYGISVITRQQAIDWMKESI